MNATGKYRVKNAPFDFKVLLPYFKNVPQNNNNSQNIQTVELQLKASFESHVEKSIKKMEQEIMTELKGNNEYSDHIKNLKTLSEADLIESLDLRESLKILWVPEEAVKLYQENNVRNIWLKYRNSRNFSWTSGSCRVNTTDISIAHGLPSWCNRHKPVIVRFP